MTNTEFLDYVEEKLRANSYALFTPEERNRIYKLASSPIQATDDNRWLTRGFIDCPEDIEPIRQRLAVQTMKRLAP